MENVVSEADPVENTRRGVEPHYKIVSIVATLGHGTLPQREPVVKATVVLYLATGAAHDVAVADEGAQHTIGHRDPCDLLHLD